MHPVRSSSYAPLHRQAHAHAGAAHTVRATAPSALRQKARWPRLWHFAGEYLLALPVGVAIALVWANTAPESYFRSTGVLRFVVNDLGMTLFFGLIAKEVVEATIAGGALHPWRRAALPFAAAIGATALPLALFAVLVPYFDEPRVLQGWPLVFATDMAFGYFAARLVFGKHPAVPFVLLLGIIANGLGLAALAATGVDTLLNPAVGAAFMTLAVVLAVLLRRAHVRSLWPYLLGGGGFSWCALYFSGLEPAFALLPILPFVPHARRDPGFFVDAQPSAHDPLSRFERLARHPAQVALLLFGIVNGGVLISALDWGTLALPLSVVLGRPAGVLAGVMVGRRLGLHLPERIGSRELLIIGLIASTGFTSALFFATACVAPGPTLSELKMGTLLTLGGLVLAAGTAMLLRTGRWMHRG
jgi:Na+:H+ antiporter, NhaA family